MFLIEKIYYEDLFSSFDVYDDNMYVIFKIFHFQRLTYKILYMSKIYVKDYMSN